MEASKTNLWGKEKDINFAESLEETREREKHSKVMGETTLKRTQDGEEDWNEQTGQILILQCRSEGKITSDSQFNAGRGEKCRQWNKEEGARDRIA